ncbi:MAG: IS5 family transposase [SAR324 cluster bacterium]|nr:IS5 family transposase [SAR324 cluster bacterium]
MKSRKKRDQYQQQFAFMDLESTLNPKMDLYQLSNQIPWESFEEWFSPLYSENGRPAHPIRLMVSLLILKHLYDLGDETVVATWIRDPYFQYFSGEESFQWDFPCAPSDLVHFRKRIGETGVEKILKVSIQIHGKEALEEDIVIDTTVAEKKVSFPTDTKLHRKIIEQSRSIAEKYGINLRQSYTKTEKKLNQDLRFPNHPKNQPRVRKARKKLKTIAGRLVRELLRKLPNEKPERLCDQLMIFGQILNQKRSDSDKIYSIHESQIYCISKGKEHKKYEFGTKVSLAMTRNSGVMIGALSFDTNQYDGATLQASLDQTKRLTGEFPKTATADRGYRGNSIVGETKIIIPKTPKKDVTAYQKRKWRNWFARRAAIEPVIGHHKTDHRMNINYYSGTFGDRINPMLAAAAFNFKKWMREKSLFIILLFQKTFFREFRDSTVEKSWFPLGKVAF